MPIDHGGDHRISLALDLFFIYWLDRILPKRHCWRVDYDVTGDDGLQVMGEALTADMNPLQRYLKAGREH